MAQCSWIYLGWKTFDLKQRPGGFPAMFNSQNKTGWASDLRTVLPESLTQSDRKHRGIKYFVVSVVSVFSSATSFREALNVLYVLAALAS